MEISKAEIQTLETETLAYIESVLGESRPFGDWGYINERTWVHYDRRIEMLTEYLPGAQALLAAFRQASAQSRFQVMGDPVVRSAINTALSHFKLNEPYTPLDELEAVLDIAAHYLAEGKHDSPLAAGAQQALRLGPAASHAWVWCDERTEDVPVRIFRRLFKLNLANIGLILRTPDDHMQHMLVQGMHLLSTLLPTLARSALNHVHLVAMVEHPVGFQAVTNPSILGTIFLSPLVLKTPWQAAEHLLHEALHQKFVDLEHTHSLLRRGYQDASSPMIRPLWHRPKPGEDNEWPINRALTVLHVYTCLALFFTVVERQAPALEQRYGPLPGLDPTNSARRAFDRAHYLGHQLKQAQQELGLAGRRFVDWLSDVLYAFDPCPPPADTYVHL